MEYLSLFIIGILCIILGCSHRKGNLSLLHSYHRHRVSEEDRIPFGKLVGLGVIIVGATMIAVGGFYAASDVLANRLWFVVGNIVMIAGLVVGIGITFYAMFKYNKGIF